jgi:hypothetical protein
MDKKLFGENVAAALANKLEDLLMFHSDEINTTLVRDRQLPISVKATLKAVGNKTEYEVTTDFVKSRSKDKASGVVTEEPEDELFDNEGKARNNVVPMKAKVEVTRPEDWYTAVDWLLGWGWDADDVEDPCRPLLLDKDYMILNGMRDAWEGYIEVVRAHYELCAMNDKNLYREEMYGHRGDDFTVGVNEGSSKECILTTFVDGELRLVEGAAV